jgi:hypothetical protein
MRRAHKVINRHFNKAQQANEKKKVNKKNLPDLFKGHGEDHPAVTCRNAGEEVIKCCLEKSQVYRAGADFSMACVLFSLSSPREEGFQQFYCFKRFTTHSF